MWSWRGQAAICQPFILIPPAISVLRPVVHNGVALYKRFAPSQWSNGESEVDKPFGLGFIYREKLFFFFYLFLFF